MALLILEQPDPRVDQQWINMAPITMQRIPRDTGHHILKVLFQRVAKLWIFFWITNPNRQVQVYGVGGGLGMASPFSCDETTFILLL